jgi:hypothetical protein
MIATIISKDESMLVLRPASDPSNVVMVYRDGPDDRTSSTMSVRQSNWRTGELRDSRVYEYGHAIKKIVLALR